MRSRRRRAKFEHHDDLEDEVSRRGIRRSGRDHGAQHEIDLHGCSLESAVRRLGAGLARCRAGGKSKVLVITGKGYGSHGGRPVLGPGIERWLRGSDAQGLGVSGIRQVRGGGAFEVSIQRSRG
ncbi:Smr domain protein [Planctomycetes bacterium Poly30]|uniref:Smr domain protein n=1 Tax=Saltatorellus ferox TaxID=2528018 RepID=A0A518EXS4_9BACT|nr:Smr domain protein [Planctomycetes bacterium Poly30]